MDESTILDLTRQLDRAIPRDGAIVRVNCEGGLPEEMECNVRLIANRAGYLRLGVACLQAAFAPHLTKDRGVSDAIQIDARDLFGENSDDPSVKFERTEDVRTIRDEAETVAETVPSPWSAGLGQLFGMLIAGFIILSLVLGAMDLIGWAISALASLVS